MLRRGQRERGVQPPGAGRRGARLMGWKVIADMGRKVTVPDVRSIVAGVLLLALGAGYSMGAFPARAETERVWESEHEGGRRIVLTVNKSRTIRILKPYATALVGATDIR